MAVAERAPYAVAKNPGRYCARTGDRPRAGSRSPADWARTLADIVARAAAGLGVTGPVGAELYKLLVYDTGSFFVSHRDTEKGRWHVRHPHHRLPSIYTDGALLVRHAAGTCSLTCALGAVGGSFAAFYATACMRCSPSPRLPADTILQLRRQGRGPAARTAELRQPTACVTALLRQWVLARKPRDDSPEKLIYPWSMPTPRRNFPSTR